MLTKTLFTFFLLQVGTFVASSPVKTPSLPPAQPAQPAQPARQLAPIHPSGEIKADTQKLYVRFQAPRAGQSTNDARVTKLQWTSTEDSVTATCKDFFNHGGNNDQLWLQFGLTSLQYAGLYQSPHMYGMDAQSGLNADNVAVTFILPSGVAKLREVQPNTIGWSVPNKQAVSGIRGIFGTLVAADYAYTTVANIKEGLEDKKDGRLRLSAVSSTGQIVPISLGLLD